MKNIVHVLAQFLLLIVFLSSLATVISSKEMPSLNIVMLSGVLVAGYAGGARYLYVKNGESE